MQLCGWAAVSKALKQGLLPAVGALEGRFGAARGSQKRFGGSGMSRGCMASLCRRELYPYAHMYFPVGLTPCSHGGISLHFWGGGVGPSSQLHIRLCGSQQQLLPTALMTQSFHFHLDSPTGSIPFLSACSFAPALPFPAHRPLLLPLLLFARCNLCCVLVARA